MKILTISGSSGGHIYPMLGFLDALTSKHKDIDLLLVLPSKCITNGVENFGYKVNYICISSIKLSFNFRNLVAIVKLIRGAWQSIIVLLKFKPDIVVGFGSLVTLPMILFARLFRIKTLIHEQNVIPGRANRFLAGFTDRIAISFSETRGHFKNYEREVVLTGNPVRKELNRIDKNKALDFFGLNGNKFTILVMGGSQSSHRVNLGFLAAVSQMQDKSAFQVIHLAGIKDLELLKKSYKELNINFRLFDFLGPMQYAYSASDLVVSRAGATTITEIISYKLPAIIIPYPFAYEHQLANARVLERMSSGIIIQDKELDGAALALNMDYLINNSERIKTMRSCYDNIPLPNANDLLVEAVLSLK